MSKFWWQVAGFFLAVLLTVTQLRPVLGVEWYGKQAPKGFGFGINRFGRAEILTPDQINVLFTEGFVNPRDRALLG